MRGLIVAASIASAVIGASAGRAGQADTNATYTYPSQAAVIPALRRWLAADAAKNDDVVVPPGSKATHPRNTGGSWRVEEWKAVASTSRFLSMSQWTTE